MSSKPTKVNNTEIIEYKTDNLLKKNKHNYKLTNEDIKEICLNHLFNKSDRDILCKKFNISERQYYYVIEKNKKNNFEILDEDIAEIRKNFSKKTSVLISKALDKIGKQLEQEDLDINKLSTTLGILYDKESLELGKSTSNNAFSINIKIDK